MPLFVRLNAVNAASFPIERRYHHYFFGEKPLMTVFFRLLDVNLIFFRWKMVMPLYIRLNAVSSTVF